VSLSERAK